MNQNLANHHFKSLDRELERLNAIGEIGACGGKTILLCYSANTEAETIDSLFQPTCLIRDAITRVEKSIGLSPDWIQEDAKTFFHTNFPAEQIYTSSHLRVFTPPPQYLLAMKSFIPAPDEEDKNDLKFLIQHLELQTSSEVFSIVSHYYPGCKLPEKVTSYIEETLRNKSS